MEITTTTSSFVLSFSSSIPRPRPRSVNLMYSSSSSNFCYSHTFLKKGSSRCKEYSSNKKGLTCNALFGLGVPELVVIAGVAALVFGPKQLPEVGRSIGKTIKSFQQAAKEFESELKKEPDSTGEGPAEKPIAVSEQAKQVIEVSSSKESV